MANVINKRKSYTIKEKLTVIERVNSGISKAQIKRELGIPEGTIRGWIAEEDKLRSFVEKLDKTPGLERKKTRHCKNEAVDDLLYTWFVQKRSVGFPLSAPVLRKQAEKIFQDLKLEGEFSATDGWLWRWQKRHGIEDVTTSDDGKSSDADSAKQFLLDLKSMCEDNSEERLFECAESPLFYKMLPTKSADSKSSPEIICPKLQQICANVLVSSNKTGTHVRSPGASLKNKNPRRMKSNKGKHFPLDYVRSSNSQETANLFSSWFHETFIPLLSSNRNVPEFLKLLNLKDIANKIGAAWESVSKDSTQNGENQPVTDKEQNSEQIVIHCDPLAVRDILQDQDVIDEWVDTDKEDLQVVCHLFTDKKKVEESDDETDEIEEEFVDVPTDQEAQQGLETAIRWLEVQRDVKQVKILQLESLKKMILQKRVSKKQKKITDFFKK